MRRNHFHGMNDLLARKGGLAQIIRRIQRVLPLEYHFTPQSWVLPHDVKSLKDHFPQSGKSKTAYIVKPDRGSKGRGIFITNEYEKIKALAKGESMVVQAYIANPML